MHFVYGDQPTEESDVRITYDKNYLWVSAKLYYKDISKMVSNSKKRDELRITQIILELSLIRTMTMKMRWLFSLCLRFKN